MWAHGAGTPGACTAWRDLCAPSPQPRPPHRRSQEHGAGALCRHDAPQPCVGFQPPGEFHQGQPASPPIALASALPAPKETLFQQRFMGTCGLHPGRR